MDRFRDPEHKYSWERPLPSSSNDEEEDLREEVNKAIQEDKDA
jgi:hypothetical protein